MQIKKVSISDVKPAKYNPRDISDSAFEGLKESIKKFGLVDPLIVNTRTNVLVGGHQRLKACEALGMTHVPVVEVDLSLAEEKALNVTLNNQKISGFYTDALQDLLDEIKIDVPEFEELKLDALFPDDDDEDKNEDKEVDASEARKIEILIQCKNEKEQEQLFCELRERQVQCVLL